MENMKTPTWIEQTEAEFLELNKKKQAGEEYDEAKLKQLESTLNTISRENDELEKDPLNDSGKYGDQKF